MTATSVDAHPVRVVIIRQVQAIRVAAQSASELIAIEIIRGVVGVQIVG